MRKKKDPTPAASTSVQDRPQAPKSLPTPVSEPSPLEIRQMQQPMLLKASEKGLQEHMDALKALRWQYKLPMMYEPSLVDVYDQAFVSHFVDMHNRVRSDSPPLHWLTRLHEVHSKSTQAALRVSIRAASMAFYARLHQDTSVLTDSYRWYITSLSRQRIALSNLDTKAVPSHDILLVPIILAVYEVYAGTTPMSVFQHLTAASKILEMMGPRNCAAGVAHQLLRAMRVSDVIVDQVTCENLTNDFKAHKCLIFNQPSVFSSPQWMTLPFTVRSKNAHQELTDIVLAIPQCLALCRIPGPLSEFFSRQIPPNTNLSLARTRTAQLLEQLHEWATKYPQFCHLNPTIIRTSFSTQSVDSMASKAPTILSDPAVTFNALSSSTCHAIHLTLILLQHKVSSDPLTSVDERSIGSEILPEPVLRETLFHTTSILQNCTVLEDNYPLGFDFMRSVFPLVVVSTIAPREIERRQANDMLARWGAKRGVGGICGPWVMR